MIGDIPNIASATHSHSFYDASQMLTGIGTAGGIGGNIIDHGMNHPPGFLRGIPDNYPHERLKEYERQIRRTQRVNQILNPQQENQMKRRIIQVFIADTDENIPLDKCLIFKGDQKLTDATDQELFFEIDIKNILEAHNAYRITVRNKKVKDREEMLEPVKVRDLKMVVVNVAEF